MSVLPFHFPQKQNRKLEVCGLLDDLRDRLIEIRRLPPAATHEEVAVTIDVFEPITEHRADAMLLHRSRQVNH
jgi:hypothetical protein